MEVRHLRQITALPEELNRAADVSKRIVNLNEATLTLRPIDHEGRTLVFNRAAGVTVTLPPATGSGARYRFIVGVTVTSNSDKIQVANASDVMTGNIIANSTGDTPDLAQPWPTAASSDTITLNGTTTGGLKGDIIEIQDIAANLYHVIGFTSCSGTEATPFSAAVS